MDGPYSLHSTKCPSLKAGRARFPRSPSEGRPSWYLLLLCTSISHFLYLYKG